MAAMSENEFTLQLVVWGYADSGDRGFSPGCVAAELRHRAVANGRPIWDDPGRLVGVTIIEEDGSKHGPPDWYALPWVTEHLMRAETFT
jgi:hypothetical protein